MTLPLEAILLGESSSMIRLRRDIAGLAATTISVLVEGETGTGKELVASALHTLSGRRGAFVAVNVAAIPDGLFESQLFGHRRGAFSGAVTDQRGYIEEADAGTLFLDEISSAPLHGQPKLLRVLETRRFRALGARAESNAELRVVAASNVSLVGEVRAKRFREDLFYRLCGDRLVVPPLRERLDDIGLLARHYAQRASAPVARDVRVASCAIVSLRRYAWPGNVRQLRAVVERAVIGMQSDTLKGEDVERVLERVAPIWGEHGGVSGDAAALLQLLEHAKWDTAKAAESLGVSRKTIYSRIQRLGLAIPDKYHRRSGESHPGASGALPPGVIEIGVVGSEIAFRGPTNPSEHVSEAALTADPMHRITE